MKKFTKLSFILIVLWIVFSANCQAQIWSEDFSTYVSGTGIDGTGNIGDYPDGVTKWTLDASAATLSDANDYIKTRYQRMYGRDLDGYIVWRTESIDISECPDGVTFSLWASEYGTMETSDYFDVYYKIDDGDYILIADWNGLGSPNHTLIDDFNSTTITQSTSPGYSLVIKVVMANNTSSEYHRFDDVMVYKNMVYSSSTTTQNSYNVAPGRTNQDIIAIKIVTEGSENPLSVSSFTVNANGSTTPVSDNIENAKIFYTGTDNTFSATNQFGSTYAAPTTTNFNISGTQELSEGTNYFWLTLDTKAGASLGEVIDAECISFVIDGVSKTPSPSAPAGSRSISTPLSGEYTIGAGGDYATFTEAVNDLMALGINAPVTFTASNGTYYEQISLSEIAGASANDTVIFQSASGNPADVILQYEPANASKNYILKFDGTDNVTFKYITFTNSGTSDYGRVVVFEGATDNINLWGCHMYGRDANHEDNTDYAVIFGEGGTGNMASGISFNSDTIHYGSYGLCFIGGDYNNLETDISIRYSVFDDFYYAGIYLYYQDSVIIYRNKLTGKGVYDYEYGIYMAYSQGAYEITSNSIFLSAPDINNGISLYECHASAARYALIANNYCSQTSTNGAYGIDVSYCNYQKIYHNSMNMRTSEKNRGGSKSYITTGCYFDGPGGSNYGYIDIQNNISSSDSRAISVSQSAVDNNYLEDSDHNDWWTGGSVLGEWGDETCSDLAEWQTKSGLDGSSVSKEPGWLSSEVPDITEEDLGESVPLTPEVTRDARGTRRNDYTTSGAVEYTNVWLGNSSDWCDPDNWSNGHVPNADEAVYIDTHNREEPDLSSDCLPVSFRTLTLNGRLDLNGQELYVHGDILVVEHSVFINGAIHFYGDNVQYLDKDLYLIEPGDQPLGASTVRFYVHNSTETTTDMEAQSVTVGSGSSFDMGGHSLYILEDVDLLEGQLDNPGKFTFEGNSTSEIVTGGNSLESVVVDKETGAWLIMQDQLIAEACEKIIIEKTGKVKLETGSKLVPGEEIVKKPGGKFIAERTYAGGEWHLISPPISDATAGIFSSRYLQYHTESDNAWTYIESATYPLEVMHGYSLWSNTSGNDMATFDGTPNSGEQSFNFSYGGGTPAGDYGWNLIGNPYTATLDWDQVTIPSNLDGTIYLFDPSIGENGDYVYYLKGGGSNTADRYVALGQGFFVHCNNTAGGTLTFTGDELVTNDATFYKSCKQNKN